MENKDKLNLKQNDKIYHLTNNIFGEMVIVEYDIIDTIVAKNVDDGKVNCVGIYCKDKIGLDVILGSNDNIFTDFGKAYEMKNVNIRFRKCYRKLKKCGILDMN